MSLTELLRRTMTLKHGIQPTSEYENYRRRAYRDIQEMWFYVRFKLKSLQKENRHLGDQGQRGS